MAEHDLIDRNTLFEKVTELYRCSTGDVHVAYRNLLDFILDMPKADVQPVNHGKWKHIAGMNSKCSVCSHYFPVIEFDSRPFDINFCPNCGADMRGVNND